VRSADLIGRAVLDREGCHVGHVHDLRLRRSPGDGSAPGRYRLEALIVGSAGFAHRLGYGRSAMVGPWPLTSVLRRLTRRSYLIPWSRVSRRDADAVHLDCTAAELPHLTEDAAH
jgi:hypothetical protein